MTELILMHTCPAPNLILLTFNHPSLIKMSQEKLNLPSWLKEYDWMTNRHMKSIVLLTQTIKGNANCIYDEISPQNFLGWLLSEKEESSVGEVEKRNSCSDLVGV